MKRPSKPQPVIEILPFTALLGETITRVTTHVGGAHLYTRSGRKFETFANMQRGAVLTEIK